MQYNGNFKKFFFGHLPTSGNVPSVLNMRKLPAQNSQVSSLFLLQDVKFSAEMLYKSQALYPKAV